MRRVPGWQRRHGFCLGRHHTAIADWPSQYGPDSPYAAEVAAVVMQLSGADFVVPIGGMMRDSASTSPTVQPPAAEAHVDFTQGFAERRAAWRCPHTAFRDDTCPDARPRRSMEFRGMAYFSRS